MTDLDAIEKRARLASITPIGAAGIFAADVLALVEEVRLARAWLFSRPGSITAPEAREAYRAFFAKREAP